MRTAIGGFGHGAGYLYPHAYRDHWVVQQYLPASLQDKCSTSRRGGGFEAEIRVRRSLVVVKPNWKL